MRRDERSEVTGHYAGPLSRLLAYLVDVAIIFFSFGLIVGGIAFVINLVSGSNVTIDENSGLIWVGGLLFWAFLYLWSSLSLTGRTPGKTLLGLRVVTRDGDTISGRQAFVRVITFPIAFLLFGLGFIGILVGRERRAIYDVFAGTAVVYDWGDRRAELPSPLSRWIQKREASLVDPAAE